MLPHHEGERLDRSGMLKLLQEIDAKLAGIQRKIPLYCLGGTALVLQNIRKSSKDVDFLVTRQDFTALSGHVAELEWKSRVRIDLFPDGSFTDYRYSEYATNAMRAPFNFKNIEVFYLDKADLMLTKLLAARDDDFKDIALFAPTSDVVPLDDLKERYSRIVPVKGKEEEIQSKFDAFVDKFYR